MAWIASLDKPLTVEGTNLVAYVTFANGTQTVPSVRIPGDSEGGILAFVARQVALYNAQDVRIIAMNAALAATTAVPGPLVLPDPSAQAAADAASAVLMTKLGAALMQKQIADATLIDPTITAAAAAVQSAQVALGSKV